MAGSSPSGNVPTDLTVMSLTDLLLTGGGGGDEGEGSPEYQPPEMPEMDVKPAMGRVGSAKGVEPEYPREFPSNGEGYLPTTTSGQQ